MNYFNQRRIPFYYLYDDKGSEIYDEITRLSEYYPYVKEEELLLEYVTQIINVDDDQYTESITLVELGAGYSTKTEIILKALLHNYKKVVYIPVDVSESACKITFQKYDKIDGLEIIPFVGTYDEYIDSKHFYKNRTIYLWLGSSIGNLEELEQIAILKRIEGIMTFRDFLLVGMDTVYKDKSIIEKAYNDEKGVTAKFIINILTHVKTKYQLELNENDFCYHPVWNENFKRVEMYLLCVQDTKISDVKNINDHVFIKKGEKIFVETSHKFSLESVKRSANSSDLFLYRTWMTDDKYFMMAKFIKSVEPLWKYTEYLFEKIIGFENLLKQPISLRNPFIFYLGHIYTFYDIKIFSLSEEEKFFQLFERGRDPLFDDPFKCHRHSIIDVEYPSYQEINEKNNILKKKVLENLCDKGYTYKIMLCIEHEIMHQETLIYMIRNCDLYFPITIPTDAFCLPKKKIITIPQRKIDQGTMDTFAWDNESPEQFLEVRSFRVDNLPITWEELRPFIEENMQLMDKLININYLFEIRVTSLKWIDYELGKYLPAWITLEIAQLYVDWVCKKGMKCRIMTEEEFDSMASVLKSTTKGNSNFFNYHAMPVGYYNDQSDDGVYELFGNGWELTASLFRPFPGFKKMELYPEYSSDFFTNHHYVSKGASPFTRSSICRKSFRNWYQHNYPYHLSKFRLVYDDPSVS